MATRLIAHYSHPFWLLVPAAHPWSSLVFNWTTESPWRRCPIACLLATMLPQRRGCHGNQDPHIIVADVLQTVGHRGIPQDAITLFQAITTVLIVGADGAL